MTNSLSAEFGDFSGTTNDTYSINKPENRQYSDKVKPFIAGVKEFRPKQDEISHVRIIAWPDTKYFAKQAVLHQGIGPEKHSFPCPKMLSEDQPCPLCKQSRIAYNNNNKTLGGAFGGKTRHLVWVIDRKNPQEGPQIWNIPDQTINDIRGKMEDMRTGMVKSIDNLDAGYDLFFRKRKETPSSQFVTINDLQLDEQPTPLGTIDQVRPWLTFIRNHKLGDILNWIPQEKMEVLAGLATEGQYETHEGELPDESTGTLPPASQLASTPLAPGQPQATLESLFAAQTPPQESAPVQAPAQPAQPAPTAPSNSLGIDVNNLMAQLQNKAQQ